MTTELKSQSELYDIIKDEIIAQNGDLSDFSVGSMLDVISGAFSISLNEITELIVSEFSKTFFDTAHGISVTGNTDDLNRLAVDHFGDRFKRPIAVESTGSVTFTRLNTDAGDVVLAIGTVIKTTKDSNGEEIRFKTTEAKTLTGLTIDATIEAFVGGADGNTDIGEVKVIETSLTDSSVTVSNSAKLAGGANEQTDPEYRETIRNLIQSLAGATKAAIEGAILAVPGVSIATLLEENQPVINYDIGGGQIEAGASFFRIPNPIAYIADVNGSFSQALIDSVEQAIFPVKACGVNIQIRGAVAVLLSVDMSITLNGGGPNFSELSQDPQKIIDSMEEYMKALSIGVGFTKNDAKTAMLDIWGSGGTNDLSNLTINSPVGDVAILSNQKIIPDGVTIS